MATRKYIVVHCTGGNPKQSVPSIRAYWKNVMGWNSPGYHYLIENDGTEHQLQVEEKATNGVRGHNHEAIHVCYVGGMDIAGKLVDTRTPAQKEKLLTRLKDLKRKYPSAKIVGHRDLSPDINKDGKIDKWEYIKACPCFDAIAEYKNL